MPSWGSVKTCSVNGPGGASSAWLAVDSVASVASSADWAGWILPFMGGAAGAKAQPAFRDLAYLNTDAESVSDAPTLPFVHYGCVSARGAVATGNTAVGGTADQSDTCQHAFHAAGVLASACAAIAGIQHDLARRVVALAGSWTHTLTHIYTHL